MDTDEDRGRLAELLGAFRRLSEVEAPVELVEPLEQGLLLLLGTLLTAVEHCAASSVDASSGDLEASILSRLHTLSTLLSTPAPRELFQQHYALRFEEALVSMLFQYRDNFAVQCSAQWGLAQVVGLPKLMDRCRPLFHPSTAFYSRAAVEGFVWTAADLPANLDWKAKVELANGVVNLLAQSDQSDYTELHKRCFQLLGARMRSDELGSLDAELQQRRVFAAGHVRQLALGLCDWVPWYAGHPQAAGPRDVVAAVATALSLVTIGQGNNPEERNEEAIQELRSFQDSDGVISQALLKLPQAAPQCDTPAKQLLELLQLTHGLAGLAKVLNLLADDGRAPCDSLTFFTIVAVQDADPSEAPQDCVGVANALLRVVGSEPDALMAENAVKALAPLMESIGAALASASGQDEFCRLELRKCARAILHLIVIFANQKDNHWPAKSARALKAAAQHDEICCAQLGQGFRQNQMVHKRIESALTRSLDYEKTIYKELKSTFEMLLVIWKVPDVISVVQQQPATSPEAWWRLLPPLCMALAEHIDEDSEQMLVSPEDALNIIQELGRRVQWLDEQRSFDGCLLGPLAQALGASFERLAADAPHRHDAATLLVLLANRGLEGRSFEPCYSASGQRPLRSAQELCWSLCAAASGPAVSALAESGAAGSLEQMVQLLVQSQLGMRNDLASALAYALEALGRLQGVGAPLQALLQYKDQGERVAQVAALLALNNLAESHLMLLDPVALAQLRGPFSELCTSEDEGIRSGAERLFGLCNMAR